jgi:hypothetical protein
MASNLTTRKITQQNLVLSNSIRANIEVLDGMSMVTDQNGKIIDLNNAIKPNGVGSTSLSIWAAIFNLLTQFNSRGMGAFSVTNLGATYTLNLPYYTTSTITTPAPVFVMDLSYFFYPPASSITNPNSANWVNWPVLSGSNNLSASSDADYIAKLVLLKNDLNNLHQFCELFVE